MMYKLFARIIHLKVVLCGFNMIVRKEGKQMVYRGFEFSLVKFLLCECWKKENVYL